MIVFEKNFLLGLLIIVAWSTAYAANGDGDMSKILSEDGTLKETITIKDAQEGFAGVSGKIWTITPSRAWYAAQFFNEEIYKPYQEGHLAKEELETVARVLADKNFFALSPEFGPGLNDKINRHLITIGFGDTKTTLVLTAGKTIVDASSDAKCIEFVKLDDFNTIVQTILALLEDKK